MQPYLVTISSEKGGVGKTTLATNLAIYLKALDEDLPVTLFSFDNHFSVDRMFRIGTAAGGGDVLDLLQGRDPAELVETGEFGVQFIPSSYRLAELRNRLDGPEVLGQVLAGAGLEGIVLIDTRPDLDIFTQNALFAADRVIVPVKDAPSLENSKHIYDFFDRHGLSRQALRILPCLIDSRIRYQGPFETPDQLLKAYALNRGYRCMEGFIAKSPKVESLNTNPEGKIFPILTHGRGTEVHQQLTDLAGQVQRDAAGTLVRRLNGIASQRSAQARDFRERAARVPDGCLLCEKSLTENDAESFYLEHSTSGRLGFVHGGCLIELLFRQVFTGGRSKELTQGMRELLMESARRCYFGFTRPATSSAAGALVFFRFDDEGRELSSRKVAPPGLMAALRSGSSSLQALWERLQGPKSETPAHPGLLLCRRVPENGPAAMLLEPAYPAFQRIMTRVAGQLPATPAVDLSA